MKRYSLLRRCGLTAVLMLLLMLILAPFAQAKRAAEPYEGSGYQVRILLSSSTAASTTIRISSGEYLILNGDDDVLATVEEGESVRLSCSSGGVEYSTDSDDGYDSEIYVLPVDADCLFTYNGTSYRGGFRLAKNGNYYYAINIVDVELYLYGVIGRELGYSYHIEALKAQAVASRSYALANIKSTNTYYDMSATTSSQVYGGYNGESSSTRQAVDDTYAMTIMYHGKPVEAYFSSNAGGYTEDIEKVWYSDAVPIKGVPSPYDKYAGNYSSYGAACYSWTVTYSADKLVSLANAYGKTDIGEFESISMLTSYNGQTSVSDRAMIVTITGSKGKVSATKDNIRSLLNLKSTLITIEEVGGGSAADSVAGYVLGRGNQLKAWSDFGDLFAMGHSLAKMKANGDADSFYVINGSGQVKKVDKTAATGASGDSVVIRGYGYGHGVGMSQWGAIAMADDGYDWEEIIEHYYCSGGPEIEAYY